MGRCYSVLVRQCVYAHARACGCVIRSLACTKLHTHSRKIRATLTYSLLQAIVSDANSARHNQHRTHGRGTPRLEQSDEKDINMKRSLGV